MWFGPTPAHEEYWVPGLQATHNSSPSRCKACLASKRCKQIRTWADGVSCKVWEKEHCQVLSVFSLERVFRSPEDGLRCYDSAEPTREVLLFSPKFAVNAAVCDWAVCAGGIGACRVTCACSLPGLGSFAVCQQNMDINIYVGFWITAFFPWYVWKKKKLKIRNVSKFTCFLRTWLN